MSEAFTIQISSNLVDRLTNEGDKLKKKTKRLKKVPKGQQIKPQLKQPPNNLEPHKSASDSSLPLNSIEPLKTAPNGGWPLQSPLFMPVSPPPSPVANAELDAIRSVLQESEKVLDRLQKQEANMVQEVTLKAKELHEEEFKLPYQKPMPCLTEKDACLECYRENAKDPLKCANVVKMFADCARKARQQLNPPLGE